MVYDDIYDAKTAVDHLSGFNVANRYLIVLYYNTNKATKKVEAYSLRLVIGSRALSSFSSSEACSSHSLKLSAALCCSLDDMFWIWDGCAM